MSVNQAYYKKEIIPNRDFYQNDVSLLLDNKEISVLSFTIRDSPEDIINVNVWGTDNYINNLYSNFKIGVVGNYKIILKYQ